ncbi:type III pantothenate kinase [Hydrogenovibrio kuenenii]|uniref:type III pantothenate kinase n=1 Tax=Hydrogenovibrio kuenenii TaxID=63658 RepID=UPI0004670C6F|nr:type III pantothenate kinase [Hydrogenovibrio kuenenii]
MKIFFELGNSRLKAACVVNNSYEFLGAVDKSLIEDGQFLEVLQLNNLEQVTNIYFCSVASADKTALLIEQIKQSFKCYPTELTSQPSCCGIKSGYDQFNLLGVDRWMSILGASIDASNPVMIVSVGTAMTIDAVIDTKHLGGFIVPGLSLMRRSLSLNTAGLDCYDEPTEQKELKLMATNTENAILGGTLYMAGSYINAVIRDLENETGRKFDCIGTGGDFLSIEPLLDKSFSYVEDLTLIGMLKVAESF